jgi:hypothetical protein
MAGNHRMLLASRFLWIEMTEMLPLMRDGEDGSGKGRMPDPGLHPGGG